MRRITIILERFVFDHPHSSFSVYFVLPVFSTVKYFVAYFQENSVGSGLANRDCHLPSSSSSAGDALADPGDADNNRSGRRDRESPDDAEKEERRRAAQRVLGKHG